MTQTDKELAALEREHFGDPDKQTGIYTPRPVAWRTRWGDGEWSYTDDGEPNRLDGREVQPLYGTPGVAPCGGSCCDCGKGCASDGVNGGGDALG